ncbi:hypothetical protein [Streptomyces sp. SID14515]|uniref:hypothetical protein n=1 Tax=Streptomyces sp. SID14515 TaxID=2706074 RepID=UPI0013CC15A9|nr:hypothetical protein [Streptomyces sp. SID14515]NEB36647.1 hypothetical protein [Streptomyces sp. SID14515]
MAHLSPASLATLRRLSADERLEMESLLLAPLVKVLGELTAEPSVVVGHLVPETEDGGAPHAFQTEIPDGSSRDLVAVVSTSRARSLVRRGAAAARPFDVALDLSQAGEDHGPAGPVTLSADTALQVVLVTGDRPALHLHHRTHLLDADYARRIGGYFRTALDHLATSLDAGHRELELPSEQEREHHLHGLAGPTVPLPDAMFPELFEARVLSHPDAVAVKGVR